MTCDQKAGRGTAVRQISVVPLKRMMLLYLDRLRQKRVPEVWVRRALKFTPGQ